MSLTCRIFKKTKNEFIYKTEADSQTKQIYGYHRGKGVKG